MSRIIDLAFSPATANTRCACATGPLGYSAISRPPLRRWTILRRRWNNGQSDELWTPRLSTPSPPDPCLTHFVLPMEIASGSHPATPISRQCGKLIGNMPNRSCGVRSLHPRTKHYCALQKRRLRLDPAIRSRPKGILGKCARRSLSGRFSPILPFAISDDASKSCLRRSWQPDHYRRPRNKALPKSLTF